MKKTMFLLMAVFLSLNSLFAQTPSKVPEDGGGGPDPCPHGCTSTLVWTLTQFNFHKPRTACHEQFGLCIKGTWSTSCDCSPWKATTSIENGNVTCIGKIEKSKLYLYIPYSLKNLEEYKNQDMTKFTVGEGISLANSNGHQFATLKPGEYDTSIEGDNFLIIIDLN